MFDAAHLLHARGREADLVTDAGPVEGHQTADEFCLDRVRVLQVLGPPVAGEGNEIAFVQVILEQRLAGLLRFDGHVSPPRSWVAIIAGSGRSRPSARNARMDSTGRSSGES